MSEPRRVLIVSHGHPDMNAGGAEIASYELFRQLRDRPDFEALYVARVPPRAGQQARLAQHTADGTEVLLHADAEHFRFSQRQHDLVYEDFRSVLEWFRPDVVHFHHYSHIGIELLREVRNYSATAKIVLTLHEYLAICNNNGQMVKTADDRLCSTASPSACHECFQHIMPEQFFLRESYIKSFFALVDAFVSPSQFLIERYVAWGLPRGKFSLIENPIRRPEPVSRPRERTSSIPGRFGFFGQMQPYKGLHVLLEAMTEIPKALLRGPDRITVDVRGSGLDQQTTEYQDRIGELSRRTRKNVTVHGRYAQSDLPSLMRAVDWVVIPSTWWENSPLVIQEAFANGVPLISSDIGGMAEKVTDGVDGLHFRVGDPAHLAERMVEAATTPGLRDKLVAGLPAVDPPSRAADRHVELYASLDGGGTEMPRRGDELREPDPKTRVAGRAERELTAPAPRR